MKNKSLLSIKINIINWEKKSSYNYNKLLFYKNNDLKKAFDGEYQNVLKNQFWSYKFTSVTVYKNG